MESNWLQKAEVKSCFDDVSENSTRWIRRYRGVETSNFINQACLRCRSSLSLAGAHSSVYFGYGYDDNVVEYLVENGMNGWSLDRPLIEWQKVGGTFRPFWLFETISKDDDARMWNLLVKINKLHVDNVHK